MVNEPEKVPNLNTMICRLYAHRTKKSWTKDTGKFGFPFNLGDFPLETMKLTRMMVRFMKGAHHDIRKTFSNFYQGHGEAIPWHHARPHVF